MGEKTSVVLLHGIGDQEQRATIRTFLTTFVQLGRAPRSEEQILRAPATADEDFSYFVADVPVDGKPFTFAEYYWADRSPVRTGFLSILLNFFRLVADVPDIIYACLGPNITGEKPRDYIVLRLLRSLLALMLWLIYFPVVAANVAYAMLVAGVALDLRLSHLADPAVATDLTAPADAGMAVLSAASLLIIGVVLLLRKNAGKYFLAIAWMGAAMLAGVFAVSSYMVFLSDDNLSLRDYSAVFQGGLDALWLFAILASLAYLFAIPFLIIFFVSRWRSILVGFATAFLVIRFWLVLITTLWLVFLTSVFEKQTYEALIGEIGGPIRFLSLVWFDLTIVGLVLFVGLMRYLAVTRMSKGQVIGRAYPRLIVPDALFVVVLILAIGGLSVILLCGCAAIFPACEDVQCQFVDEPTQWIILNAASLLAVGGIVIQFAHQGFEVALDIANFFKTDRGHRLVNPFAAVVSIFKYDPQNHSPFRNDLKARLIALAQDLVEWRGGFDRSVIVAHSLGSIIAVDVLHDFAKRGETADGVELVTMGSPYSAIFNYYFPHMFAPASQELLPNVARWTNIYSENDYVGTRLSDGQGAIVEVVEPPFGHVAYFENPEVVGRIGDLLTGRNAEAKET